MPILGLIALMTIVLVAMYYILKNLSTASSNKLFLFGLEWTLLSISLFVLNVSLSLDALIYVGLFSLLAGFLLSTWALFKRD